MNSVNIVGNLTKDPESRQVGDDNSVCTLRVAVNRRKPRGGGEAKTDYFDVKVWGPSGKACQDFLVKGNKVAVTGRIQIDEVDRNDDSGKKAYFTSIVANEVDFLTPKGEGGAPAGKPTETKEEDLGF